MAFSSEVFDQQLLAF